MPTLFNEQSAQLGSQGALTLGIGGTSVQTGDNFDTTYPYAHNDFFMTVPLNTLMPVSIANMVWVITRGTTGVMGLQGTCSSSAATPQVLVQFPIPQRTFNPTGATAPHGYVLNSVDIAYGISGGAINSITTGFNTILLANGVTATQVSTTPLGTITVQNPIGTTAALGLPTALTGTFLPTVARLVPGTRAWITTDQTELNLELTVGMNSSSVITIEKVQARFSLATY